MSLSADPTPSADPAALPANPTDYRRRQSDGRIMGPFYWGLMIGALICVLAGIVVAKFLPSLLTVKLPQAPPAATHPAGPVEPAAEATPAALAATEAAPAATAAPGQVTELNARLDRLEAGQRRTTAAAGAALATASLVQAAQASKPFSGELAAVAALLPPDADISALRTIAITGAPTRAALATEYGDAAAKAAVAARAPSQGESFAARAARALAAIVTIRRVDHVKGDSPDAVLARAETMTDEGDLEGAVKELSRLPTRGPAAMAPWRGRAQMRIDVDRHVAAIRADAVRSLTQTVAANP
jgi:hypothetical protein